MTTPDRKGPSEDAVRGQFHKERDRVADGASPAEDAASPETDRDEAVVEVEAARSAEARIATESAPAADAQAEQEVAAQDDGPADVEAERDRYLDLAKRTQADFDNYRKRAAKDAAAAGARAKAGLVRELLPVVDNLERALASASESDEGIAHGVRLVHADLVGVLERNGIVAQEPAGERFDPTEHEAVSMRQEEGAEAGVILDVVEKGYRLNDTIIRPARVVVSG